MATILDIDQGGTGANLIATGGFHHVVRQHGVGAPFTVSQLSAYDDIKGLSVPEGMTLMMDDEGLILNGGIRSYQLILDTTVLRINPETMPTAPGYVLTDISGDGILRLQPPAGPVAATLQAVTDAGAYTYTPFGYQWYDAGIGDIHIAEFAWDDQYYSGMVRLQSASITGVTPWTEYRVTGIRMFGAQRMLNFPLYTPNDSYIVTSTTVNGTKVFADETGNIDLGTISGGGGDGWTIAEGKTPAVNNTITLNGTDGRIYTFPPVDATLAGLAGPQTFTGIQNFESVTTKLITGDSSPTPLIIQASNATGLNPGADIIFRSGDWRADPAMRIFNNGYVNFGLNPNPSSVFSVSPGASLTGTASQSGNVITGEGTTFLAGHVGCYFYFADGTYGGTITGFTDATHITMSVSQTIASQAFTVMYPGIQVTTYGAVGIGRTPSSARLHTQSEDGGIFPLGISGTTKGIRFITSAAFITMQGVDNTLGASYQPLAIYGTDLFLKSGPSGGSDIIKLTSTGNVGINSANPLAKLTIVDTTLAGSGALAGSVLEISQTWNTTGVPIAIRLNVTDTASNVSASKLMDLQVGGVSKFFVHKTGATTSIYGTGSVKINDVTSGAPLIRITTGAGQSGPQLIIHDAGNTNGQYALVTGLGSTDNFTIRNVTTSLELMRFHAAGNVGIGTLTTPAKLNIVDTVNAGSAALAGSALEISQTWNTTGSPVALRVNVTNTAVGASAYLMNLVLNGQHIFRFYPSSQFTLGAAGPSFYSSTPSGTGPDPTTAGGALRIAPNNPVDVVGYGIMLSNAAVTGTAQISGDNGFMVFRNSGFSPTSGNGAFSVIRIESIFNQTGGANGITRGLWIAPVLTAAADFRAIQLDNATGSGVYQSSSNASNFFAGTTTFGSIVYLNRAPGASTTALSLTGAWFTGGSAITTKPHFLIEPTGAVSTGWNIQGTGLGINSASTFNGWLISAQVNGADKFHTDYLGNTVTMGYYAAQNGLRANSAAALLLGWPVATLHPTANTFLIDAAAGTMTMTSGTNGGLYIHPTYNQVGSTAANTDLLINRTETAIGSGAQFLIDAQIGGLSKFKVDRNGGITFGSSAAGLAFSGIATIYVGTATTTMGVRALANAPNTLTSGSISFFNIESSYNQTASTAANTDLRINRTETSVGSGLQKLIDAQVGGVSKFSVDTEGNITTAGTVTGTANVQGSSRIVLVSNVTKANTGALDNTEIDLFTGTIPANSIGINGSFHMTAVWSIANTANSKTVRIRFNNVTVMQYTLPTTAMSVSTYAIIRNRGSLTSQISGPNNASGNGTFNLASAAAPAVSSFNTGADIVVRVTSTNAIGADIIAMEGFEVIAFF